MDTTEIKRRVPIESAITHYGGSLNVRGEGRCLFPHKHKNGDVHPSMTVRDGRVKCWSQNCFGEKGADVFELVGLMERLSSFADQKRRVMEIGDIPDTTNGTGKREEVATYDYTDESGQLLFQVVRFKPKDFRQRRPDGKGGWIWNLKDTRLVLYRLPDVLKAESVLIVEGEKDVETTYRLGLPEGWAATCNAMGAGKWRPEYSDTLRGKRVVILPDADEPGRRHGEQVARSLEGKAAEVLTLHLPHGKDLSEWSEQGRTQEAFHGLLNEGQSWAAAHVDADAEADGIVLIGADSVKPLPVDWAWARRIPLGSLTVIAGLPGQGKSTITLDLAAGWSKGTLEGDLLRKPSRIVIASAEDSASRTMVPRLIAAWADLTQIKFMTLRRDGVDCGITLPQDVQAIREVMQQWGANVLIVDPLMAHLSEKVDGHKDQHIRRALAPLARLAEELQASVIAVAHLNKSQAEEILDRVGGSRGITAAARSVLVAAPHPEQPPDSNFHVLVHAKSNLSPQAKTLTYQTIGLCVTEKQIPTSKIEWGGECDLTAQDLTIRPDQNERHDRQEAARWLMAFLSDGSKDATEVFKEGNRLGFSESTLNRAKKTAGILSDKRAFSGNNSWVWRLPPQAAEGTQGPSEDSQCSHAEHLRKTGVEKATYVNNLDEDAQPFDFDHLRDERGHLYPSSYPIGSRIRFNGGMGFEEKGVVEAHTTWSQFPGQVCYRVKGRTVPHSRVLGVEGNV